MSYLSRIRAASEPDAQLTTVVSNMMGNPKFVEAIDSMIEASKAAITLGHVTHNDALLKFNTLCLSLFSAIKTKNEKAAIEAARALVSAGHGKAFGLA